MPVIEINIRDIEELVGRKLSVEELTKLLMSLKGEIEEVEEENIKVEVTHERPDLFSAEGIARAIRGLLEIETGLPKVKVERLSSLIVDAREAPSYRPYIAVAMVRNVRLSDEAVKQLMQLQEKLHMTYGRNRRKISIGIHDASAVDLPLKYVGVPAEKVKFPPLNYEREMTFDEILTEVEKGREYGHLVKREEVPLLVDSKGMVLSMPPIINSNYTKVTERSRDLIIDVTGTDPQLVVQIATIVAYSIAVRGEAIVKGVTAYGDSKSEAPVTEPGEITSTVDFINSYIGLDLTPEDIRKLLLKMRHDAEVSDGVVRVKYAPYRIDIMHEVDVAEDVAIAYGYDRLVPELPLHHATFGKPHPLEFFSDVVREVMIGLGFIEVMSWMLTDKDVLTTRVLLSDPVVELANPKVEHMNAVRNRLFPVLLDFLAKNKTVAYPHKVFEVGDVAIPDEALENKARIERHMAFAIADRKVTLTDALVTLKAFMRSLGISYRLEPTRIPTFIEGRTAKVIVDNVEVGYVGEVHPQVLENFGLEVPVVVGELNLEKLLDAYRRGHLLA